MRGDREADEIPIFKKGIKHFLPGKEFVFWYGTFPEVFGEKKPDVFTVKVTYNRINDPITLYSEDFHININDYYMTSLPKDPAIEELERISAAVNKLGSDLPGHLKQMDQLVNIAGPSGLDLSVSTLRNITHILNREPFEKIHSRYVCEEMIMELLGIDMETAYKIVHWIRFDKQSDPLQKYSLTPEIIEKLQRLIQLDDES